MKAAVLHEFRGEFSFETVDDPRLEDDSVMVKINAVGLCRSDHHAWSGVDPDVHLPAVLGHEFSGEVVTRGKAVKTVPLGARVTAPFVLGCSVCADCKAGMNTICNSQDVIGFTYQGAFAEYIAIPHADVNAVVLPDELSDIGAAALGCRVTTAYGGLFERGDLQTDEWIAIHGMGGIGLSALLLAKAKGAKVIAIDIKDEALQFAQENGAEHVLNAQDTELIDKIHEITGGGAHLSLDALGITASFQNSLRSLKKRGRHVQIGMPVGPDAMQSLPLLELVYARQLALFGTRGLAPVHFPELFSLLQQGQVNPDQLVQKITPLDDLNPAMRAMDENRGFGITMFSGFA